MAEIAKIEKLNALISDIELASKEGSITNNMVAEALSLLRDVKQEAFPNKGLSANDFTNELKEKLEGIATGANNYKYPSDWSGTQTEYNSLAEYDSDRWYFIVSNNEVVAMYRGSSLIWAVPNCVGQFADDSMEADWYWWPNGVKTALPVDPVTKRFSFYWPEVLKSTERLFSGGAAEFDNTALIRLEKIPPAKSIGGMLYYMKSLEVYPVLDGSDLELLYGLYYTMNYVLMNSSRRPRDVYFRNTGHVTEFEMTINNNSGRDPDYWATRVFGIDLSRAEKIALSPFGGTTALIQAVNLGKRQELQTADFRSVYWGDDSVCAGARQSVIDTLLTNSFDRASAGYSVATIRLSAYTAGLLTAEEKAAITAKGFTITAE